MTSNWELMIVSIDDNGELSRQSLPWFGEIGVRLLSLWTTQCF
jgi:hypothetical protein